VNQLPIDPHASRTRRAWVPCPNCDHGRDCAHCRDRVNCRTHWQYLLRNVGTRVSLQCPTCAHLWSADLTRMPDREQRQTTTIAVDGFAHHVVAGPHGDYVYATTAKSVNIIDRDHRVVASVALGVDPKHTIVSPDGSRIYVTGYDGSVSIIDAADHTVRTVEREASAAEVISPEDNYLYLAHNQGRNCWISAMAHDGTTATIVPVDSYATALALAADGSRLYVASSKPTARKQRGHGAISIIDTDTFTVTDVIAMQACPDAITVSPDGSVVYAAHYHTNAVSVVDLASGSQTLITLADAPLDLQITADGAHLYVTNLHSLALIDVASKQVEAVPVGSLPRQLHLSRDGKRAYFTDFGHDCVWVLDTASKSIVNRIDMPIKPEVLALSADGGFLYAADYLSPTLIVIALS
jgi:YVTN family beta-propeller protein